MEDGSFAFDHTERRDHTPLLNSFALHLPLFLVGGTSAFPLGTVDFGDEDFYDGELTPGFEYDLSGIGGIFDSGTLVTP